MKNKSPKEVNQSFYLKKIKGLFTIIVTKLKENSYLKNKLVSNFKFIPNLLFHNLDFFSKKKIISQDFIFYLTEHNIKFNDEIIRRLITQYDKCGKNNLIYDDFVKMISPYNKKINDIDSKENINKIGEVDEIFCTILINELKLIGLIGDKNLEIRKDNNFNDYIVFMEICENEQNLNKEILYNFLDGKFSDLDIDQLVYYLDRNNDGLIPYEDFRDLLRPIKSDLELNIFEENNENDFKINNIIYHNNKYYIIENNDSNNFNINSSPISPIPKSPDLSNNYYNYDNENNNLNEKNNINNEENYEDDLFNPSIQKVDKEKEYLYEKYLYNNNMDDINNEKNENYHDLENYNTSEIIPKILKEDGEGIHDIKGATFTFGNKILNNNIIIQNEDIIQDNNINKENYNNNINEENKSSLENKIYDNEKNNFDDIDEIQNQIIVQSPLKPHESIEINDNVEKNNINTNINNNNTLPKFPMAFGINQENDFVNQITPDEVDNNNKVNSSKTINYDYNEEINYYFHNNLNKDNNIRTYNNIKFQTINNNLTIDPELNYSPNFNTIPQNLYFSPIKQNENKKTITYEINGNNEKNYYYKKNKNNIEAINNFLEYINLIIFNENKLEHIKEKLIIREDLTLKEIFILFDKEQNGYISIKNFQFICKKIFNLYPTSDQIKLVFKRYKKQLNNNRKDKLTLNLCEFLNMMSPNESEYYNIINDKNIMDKTNIKLSIISKNILIELIKCLIQKETDYYRIKNKLNEECIEELWKVILKYSKKNKITKKQMKKLLKEYGYILDDKQINNIFFIFDKSKKGVIKFKDFFEEMINL